jgi:hypothetical protein
MKKIISILFAVLAFTSILTESAALTLSKNNLHFICGAGFYIDIN